MFINLDKLRQTAEAIRTTKDEAVSLGVIPIFANSATTLADALIRQFEARSGIILG